MHEEGWACRGRGLQFWNFLWAIWMELPNNRRWISRFGAWQKGLMSKSSVGIQQPPGGGGKPGEWMMETQRSHPVWESDPRVQRGLRRSPLLAIFRRKTRFPKNVVDHFSSLCVGGTGKTQLETPFRSHLHSALFCSSFIRVPSFRPDPASPSINQYQGSQLVYFFSLSFLRILLKSQLHFLVPNKAFKRYNGNVDILHFHKTHLWAYHV